MKNILKSCKIKKKIILTPLFWYPIWAIYIAKDKPVYKTKLYLTLEIVGYKDCRSVIHYDGQKRWSCKIGLFCLSLAFQFI